MQPQENVPLSAYSTMRLGGPAKYLLEIHSPFEIQSAVEWASAQNCKVIMIGSGSNIIWTDGGFDGLVLVNKIIGFEQQDQGDQVFITVGGGEPWDSVVARTVAHNLSGIEQLSLIPGLTGATPIQNVGAYGREIADVLVCVQAYDSVDKKMVVLPKIDCGFAYRKSRFNSVDKGRFFISSVTLALSIHPPMPPFYDSLQSYLSENNITSFTPANIREAVVAIRSAKLPDPAKVANCGSFFANPIVEFDHVQTLLETYPQIQYWELGDNTVKVSAAWMLDYLGLKGYHEPNTGMAIWDKQPLVFVNEKAPNTAALLAFRDAIVARVQEKFGITLQQEPELI